MTRNTIYLFGVLRRFQHCTGHITTGSWKGRGNQYMQFLRVLYCKLPTNGKQLPAFPLEAVLGIEPRPQRWEERVLPLCHHGPRNSIKNIPIMVLPQFKFFSVPLILFTVSGNGTLLFTDLIILFQKAYLFPPPEKIFGHAVCPVFIIHSFACTQRVFK